MLDSIKRVPEVGVTDPVLVSAAHIKAARERHALLREAQRRARTLVKDALEEAELIRRAACSEGYVQGVLAAADALGALMLHERGSAARIQQEAVAALEQMLAELMLTPSWTELLLQRWVNQLSVVQGAALQVRVPIACKPTAAQRLAALQRHWSGTLHIEYHALPVFMFRLGDQVLELDVPQTAARLTPRISAQIESLRSAPRSLDALARRQLQEWSETFISPSDEHEH
jgi:hypothetical protein